MTNRDTVDKPETARGRQKGGGIKPHEETPTKNGFQPPSPRLVLSHPLVIPKMNSLRDSQTLRLPDLPSGVGSAGSSTKVSYSPHLQNYRPDFFLSAVDQVIVGQKLKGSLYRG